MKFIYKSYDANIIFIKHLMITYKRVFTNWQECIAERFVSQHDMKTELPS